MTSQLALIAFSGLLGSAHCVGMCGGFAVMIGTPVTGWRRSTARQGIYSLGRIATYTMLGALAGYFGVRLAQSALIPQALNIAAILSITCGLLLVSEGLKASGVTLFRKRAANPCGGCLSQGFFRAFLQTPGATSAFIAGVLTGFLPCGLVYGFLALAAAERDPLRGMAVMAAFGLGTVPLMVATGLGSAVLTAPVRRKLLRVAAACVVITGLITVYRGLGFLKTSPTQTAPACPFCVQSHEPGAS